MLGLMKITLQEVLQQQPKKVTDSERLIYFLSKNNAEFTRKDYLQFFKNLSTASASRDLKTGVEKNWISKKGEKNKTVYKRNPKFKS
mgnify:CR=1 FL=1